ncbi:MAG: hypothetical protein ACRDBY_08645 [Cetobacterium sp.]
MKITITNKEVKYLNTIQKEAVKFIKALGHTCPEAKQLENIFANYRQYGVRINPTFVDRKIGYTITIDDRLTAQVLILYTQIITKATPVAQQAIRLMNMFTDFKQFTTTAVDDTLSEMVFISDKICYEEKESKRQYKRARAQIGINEDDVKEALAKNPHNIEIPDFPGMDLDFIKNDANRLNKRF